MGIAAEAYRALKTGGPYAKARIIYYNALFDQQSGYNFLTTLPQKIARLDPALNGMLRFAPDMILLASNTLSVLYPHTAFSQAAGVPVLGLIDIGVNHILSHVQQTQDSAVILFATPTTVEEGVFRTRLRRHLDDARIVQQACHGLDYAIGDGDRPEIVRLIERAVAEALQRLPAGIRRVYGSLHCTHFGYYQREFLDAFQRCGFTDADVLNPSSEMANALRADPCPVAENPDISIEFVSKVNFHPDGMASLLPYLTPIAPEVATAFQHYTYNPQLF